MDALKIPLSAVTGLELEVDAVVPGKDLQPPGAADLALSDVAVQGTLQEVGDEYLFRGTVSGRYLGACDRCLEPVEAPFSIDVMWDIAPGQDLEGLEEFMSSDQDDDDYSELDAGRTFEGNEINLAGFVWEEIVLGLPSKFLCGSDCQGLCPQCGANLNAGRCGCVPAEPSRDSSFAGLKDMFPELRDKDSEE